MRVEDQKFHQSLHLGVLPHLPNLTNDTLKITIGKSNLFTNCKFEITMIISK